MPMLTSNRGPEILQAEVSYAWNEDTDRRCNNKYIQRLRHKITGFGMRPVPLSVPLYMRRFINPHVASYYHEIGTKEIGER